MKLKHLIIFSLTLVTTFSAYLTPAFAKTAEEIQQEINAKNAQLSELQKKLSESQKNLNYYKSQKDSASSESAKIDAEISEIETQIELNNLKLQELEQSKSIKELEKEESEKMQDTYVVDSYLSWKMTNITDIIFTEADFVKNATYQTAITLDEKEGINGLTKELEQLNADLATYLTEKANLERQTADLESKKVELAAQLTQLNSSIVAGSGDVNSLKSQVGQVKGLIDQLTAAQKAAQIKNDQLTGGGSGGTQPLVPGEVYFTGQGRDAKQGHGVGMSQYGAHGMATKGWNYSQILTFYYTGVQVADYAASSQISIVYCSKNPTYDTPPCDAGSTQIVKRIDLNDYLGGLGEMPESWPAEARKAQMIAARTYALRATSNGSPSLPICITANCQVSYLRSGGTDADLMDNGDYQIAVDTANKVITYGGALISAVYSSDNNQGYGTANNDTRFTNFSGGGTAYAYLRSVNDGAYATPTQYTNFKWRTNSYTMAEVDQMFTYAAQNYSSYSSNLKTLKSTVGTVTGLSFTKDPSNRVKQVTVNGTKGSATIAGWLFTYIWNDWVANVKPSGQTDFIYSTTFWMG